eukprot:2097916-Amphidinium_carterae.2
MHALINRWHHRDFQPIPANRPPILKHGERILSSVGLQGSRMEWDHNRHLSSASLCDSGKQSRHPSDLSANERKAYTAWHVDSGQPHTSFKTAGTGSDEAVALQDRSSCNHLLLRVHTDKSSCETRAAEVHFEEFARLHIWGLITSIE